MNFDGQTAIKDGELYEEKFVPNKLLGVEVGRAKVIFGLLSGLSLMAFTGIILTSKDEIKRRNEKTFYRKHSNVMFTAASKPEFEKIVELKDLDSIGRISYELDKPIIKFNNEFMVIDGDTAYIFRN